MKKSDTLTILTRPAERLLAVLGGEGTYAFADPTQPGTVLVRTERKGVSVGGGQFRAEAVEELVRHDLIDSVKSAKERGRFRISEPGRAYLRRRAADEESAFQVQHQDRLEVDAEVEGERVSVTLDAAESPLDWLRRRRDRRGEPRTRRESACAGI